MIVFLESVRVADRVQKAARTLAACTDDSNNNNAVGHLDLKNLNGYYNILDLIIIA